ncbi:MAG: diguanylate cyclase [Saccharofermentanales bacterium]
MNDAGEVNQSFQAEFFKSLDDSFVSKTIMENSTDSIYFKDMNGRFVYVNRTKASNNGIDDPSEMIGMTDHDFITKENADKIADQEKKIIETGKEITGLIEKLIRVDGRTTWVSVSKSPVRNDDGEIIGIFGISRDITEAESAKEELRFNENRNKIIFDNINEVIEIIDINGITTYQSPNTRKLMGWDPLESVNRSSFEFVHPDDLNMLFAKFNEIVEKPGAMSGAEFRAIKGDGSYAHLELYAKNMLDNEFIEGIILNYHDISLRKKQEEKILYLSYHDSLTGLYNRSFYEEEKKRLDTEEQLPFSVIMGDVNGLKLTNDSYGHVEGDRLLIEISRILGECCREEDIIARIGGDEFCILMPRTDLETAESICGKISEACKNCQSDHESKSKIYPSISLGYASKTDIKQSIDDVLKSAEDLMYRKKLLEKDTTRSSIINPIQTAMYEHTKETEEHSDRMVSMAVKLGKRIGLSDEQLLELDLLSRLHDIGKICIDDNILSKPGELSPDEWAKVRQHPEVGYQIARASAELIRIAQLILNHHERWDGTGYPQRLRGDNIPLLSRIVAVIDAYPLPIHLMR